MSAVRISLSKLPRTVWMSTLLSALLAALIFSLWPELDLYTSSFFYQGKGLFYLVDNPLGTIPRLLFKTIFIVFCLVVLIGLGYSLYTHKNPAGLGAPHWAYLVACLIIGPGILTNSILKDHWGRARPIQTQQFGSTGKFTPALVPSTACERNCSFVSGESSSIYMVFFSLALLFAAFRKQLILAGIVVGSLSGLVRMGMGGHFLSDVAFSGIFMLATAATLYSLFFCIFRHVN